MVYREHPFGGPETADFMSNFMRATADTEQHSSYRKMHWRHNCSLFGIVFGAFSQSKSHPHMSSLGCGVE